MYSQDPKVRRRRMKLRFFYYGLMTFGVLVLTFVGVLLVLGYRLDFNKDAVNVSRGGLLKFDTRPQDASVALDGTALQNTPYQVNTTSGRHIVRYNKTGYQDWQKTVTMRPGELLWLNYARLIPSSITTTPLREFPALHQTLTSPNRKWMALHEAADSPSFLIADAGNERAIKFTTLILPETGFTKKPDVAHAFHLMSWDADNRFLLIKHTFGEEAEYLRVPRDDQTKALNLTKLFGLPLTNVQFAANTANVVFAADHSGVLYRLDVNAPTDDTKIAEGVISFENLNDDKVAFVAPSSNTTQKDFSLAIWQQSTKKRTEIKPVPASPMPLITYAPYLSHDYLTVVAGNNLMMYQDALSSKRKTIQNTTLTFSPEALLPSPGSRFILAQAKETLYIYDIELVMGHSLQSPNEARAPVQWVDDYHVALTGDGSVRFVEFDGTNTQQVTQIAPGGFDSLIGIDGRVFLSIGRNKASNALELQQSQLLTEPDQNAGLF